ncbi:hypothetical protein IJJ08_00860 [bacterium]|nr:hypothetical protein [bacterium]
MSRVFGRVFLAAIFLLTTGQLIWAASGNKTMKLKDVAAGKVVQVGNVKFVKVAADKYLALDLCPQGSTYSSFYKGCVVETTTFDYTGDYQTFTAPETGMYVAELWGAQGTASKSWVGGNGAYTRGNIDLDSGATAYIYVGGKAKTDGYNGAVGGGTNGSNGAGGGGASDIRFFTATNPSDELLAWNDELGLNARHMVAGGGGGPTSRGGGYGDGNGGNAGGLQSYTVNPINVDSSVSGGGSSTPATQTAGATVHVNWMDINSVGLFGRSNEGYACSGGGGYYAGAGRLHVPCPGGSSFISGHTGCVAIAEGSTTNPRAVKISGCTTGATNNACSIHYSGKYFTHTVMIDGAGYSWTNTKGDLTPMPDPTSVGSYYDAGVGHTGNGAARITQLSVYLGI